MYNPKVFKQENADCLHKFIEANPFANLVTYLDDEIVVNHLPVLSVQKNGLQVLEGHIAKANTLWKTLKNNSPVTVIFNGPNCYISPNYYPSKQKNGKAVPTWNYVSVHVKGTLTFTEDKTWNLAMLNRLTDRFEANQAQPWSISDAPTEYIDRMLSAIVGFEIAISSIEGKWKVSQNQTPENKQGIIQGLANEQGENASLIRELVNNF